MKIALIQQTCSTDKTVNIDKGLSAARKAAEAGSNVICFPELSFTLFYPQYHNPDWLS